MHPEGIPFGPLPPPEHIINDIMAFLNELRELDQGGVLNPPGQAASGSANSNGRGNTGNINVMSRLTIVYANGQIIHRVEERI